MIFLLLWPAARSSRFTIFLMLACIAPIILNCTSAVMRALEISFKHSVNTFSSMKVALLICWRAREMRPPSSASTILPAFFLQPQTLPPPLASPTLPTTTTPPALAKFQLQQHHGTLAPASYQCPARACRIPSFASFDCIRNTNLACSEEMPGVRQNPKAPSRRRPPPASSRSSPKQGRLTSSGCVDECVSTSRTLMGC